MMKKTEKTKAYKLFSAKQKVDRILIDTYKDKIERVFQIYFECDAKLNISKMYRISPESNFMVVIASAFLKEGDIIKTGNEHKTVEQDINLVLEFFMPIFQLDTGTPYQICDTIRCLMRIKTSCEDSFFMKKVHDPEFYADDPYKTIQESVDEKEPSVDKTDIEFKQYGDKVDGFDLDGLDESQKKRLKVALMSNTEGKA